MENPETEYRGMHITLCRGWRAGRYAEVRHTRDRSTMYTSNKRWGAGAQAQSLEDAKAWIDENWHWIARLQAARHKEDDEE